jgi:hypothetical protein
MRDPTGAAEYEPRSRGRGMKDGGARHLPGCIPMSNDKKTIRVIPSGAGSTQTKGGFLADNPRPLDLDVGKLRDNLRDFINSLNETLSSIPQLSAPFKLQELEVTVEVTGEGSIQLIGGVKIGASGGITLHLKQ